MGRHSAAGDDEADLPEAAVASVAVDSRGRHSRGDEGEAPVSIAEAVPEAFVKPRPSPVTDTAPTEPIPAAAPEEAIFSTQPIRPVEAPSAEPVAEPSPTARDFALFREHSDVRNRAIAAVLAPFVIYAVVMVVIGRTDVFLIWIWIPLILAGVLMGLVLDLGHKRYGATGSADRP